jgi:hypothetical protein
VILSASEGSAFSGMAAGDGEGQQQILRFAQDDSVSLDDSRLRQT